MTRPDWQMSLFFMTVSKVLFALLLLASPVCAKDLWLSSNTATSDGFQVLCGGGRRGILHGVCTNTSVATTSMSVVNSSFTITGKTFGNRGTSVGSLCLYYDVYAEKGLAYDKFGTADMTITYVCY